MAEFDGARYSQTLSDMVKIPTVSLSDDKSTVESQRFISYVKERFPLMRDRAEWVDDFFGGMMIIWRGSNEKKKPLVLMSHYDVAPVEDKNWTYPAFSGEIVDGKIWGRGTADTKGSLCGILEACEKLMAEDFTPSADIYILSSSREEIGGKDAVLMASYMKEHRINPAILMDEGGAILDKPMSFINGRFAMIAMSERSSAEFTVSGKKENMTDFRKKMMKAPLALPNLPAEVAEMFRRMVPKMSFPMNLFFKNLRYTKGLLLTALGYSGKEAAAMVATSVSFKSLTSIRKRKRKISKYETNDTLKLSCTYYHNLDNILDKVKKIAKRYDVELNEVAVRYAPRPTDFQNIGVKLAEKTVFDTFKNTFPIPFVIFGGTDARHFDGVADCVIRFAPLLMNHEIIRSVHKTNEYIFEESVLGAVKYYYNFVRNFENFSGYYKAESQETAEKSEVIPS